MPMVIRKSEDRGQTRLKWLESRHSFSFAHYYDPNIMGFHSLRVINEDIIAANSGFDTHPHDNMEIITYVMRGTLSHKDSMGNEEYIHEGEIQRMSAGTGIRHSEYNLDKKQDVHLLQIWFLPEHRDVQPSYQQKQFDNDRRQNEFCLFISKEGVCGSLSVNLDMNMYGLWLQNEKIKEFSCQTDYAQWIQVTKGKITVNDKILHQGDGAAIWDIKTLVFKAKSDCEIILFDMKQSS